MALKVAVKEDSMKVYDEDLHRRFLLWKDQSGTSANTIAGMIGRSGAAVSQYTNKTYAGDIQSLEKDIASLLAREEDLQFTVRPAEFCSTSASKLIWEVLQYCDAAQKMGAAVAPSGTGKTETCKEYKVQNRATIFVTLDITKRHPSSVLKAIAKHISVPRNQSIAEMLDAMVDRLKGTKRLLILDDAHFMTWESFELVRKIHDCARIGIVYVGQERLYEQMKGQDPRGYLFDQIYSRIAMKRDRFGVTKNDAGMIAEAHLPGLDKGCVDYLFEIAKSKGRYRRMVNLLEVAAESHKQYGRKLDIELLRSASRLLMGE